MQKKQYESQVTDLGAKGCALRCISSNKVSYYPQLWKKADKHIMGVLQCNGNVDFTITMMNYLI